MIELKARGVDDVYIEYYETGKHELAQVYLKSEADKEFRKLQRALWLARAERAEEIHFMWCQFIYDRKYGIVKFNVKKEWGENIKKGQILHTPQGWADVWDEVEYKCRKYADKFKEG